MPSADIVLAVVRGARPLSDLRLAGIRLDLAGGGVGIGAGDALVRPTAADLAAGLVAYARRDGDRRTWAFVVLTGGFADLSALDGDADGEVMVGGLWEASFGRPVPDAARARAEMLAEADSRAEPRP
jgi:hypothetical protein